MTRAISVAILLVIAGIIFATTNTVITVYNTLVKSKVRVEQYLSDLDSEYQRRYALVDNLVAVVKETKGFEQSLMEFEKAVYIETAEAKASATKLSFQAPEASGKRIQQEERLTSALSQFVEKFLILAQHYPTIPDPPVREHNQTFQALTGLKEDLKEIEQQILDSRRSLNDSVRVYNQNLQIFPANLFAASWGFARTQGFEVINEDARQDARIKF